MQMNITNSQKMEQNSSSSCRIVCSPALMFITSVLCIMSSSSSYSRSGVEAYKNYTVGDSLGWYDTLENPNVNYQKWVASKNFTLGDFLLFNTDTNHSVIQTYNFTTYKECNYEDALDNDTVQWSSADPSNTSPHPVSIAVPLLKQGRTYFFSSDYDGEQCKHGQRFKINVTYGQGLPKTLITPSQNAPSPTNPVSGADDDSAPDTLVPSNFDHPRQTDDDNNEASLAVSLSVVFIEVFGWQLNGLFIFFGFISLF